jgi:hypothetical protein
MKPCGSCLDVVQSTLLLQRQPDRLIKKFKDEIENKWWDWQEKKSLDPTSYLAQI